VKGIALQRSLGLLLGLLLLAAVFITSLGERRVDLWWQLSQGLSIVATHHLPEQAPAAFGLPRLPFVDEYSLYEIGLAVLDKLGGLAAIHLAFIALYLAIFLVPLSAARTLRCDPVGAALLALAIVFLVNRYEQRPELAGVLLLVLLVALLRRTLAWTPGFSLGLALLFAIWTNVHSSYLIGLLALAFWLADRLGATQPAERWHWTRAAITFALAAGALLLNPYGLRRIAFTFAEETDLGSNLLSREMWAAWDQPPRIAALLAVTAVVLAWAVAGRPRSARWLLGLTGALYLLSLAHFRHISFLAVPVLFLCADRMRASPVPRWLPLRVLALGAGCIAVLLFDTLAARNARANLVAGDALADRGFAPGLFLPTSRGAALCHDAEGSFLTFRQPALFPLIDSGQGRFDDATKRYYFFTVQDPHAFDLALQQLSNVDDVIVTPPVEGWTLALLDRSGWFLEACDAHGLRFHRFDRREPAPLLGSSENIRLVREANLDRDQALREGDLIQTFCFSVLAHPPAESLALLDQSPPETWSESFFSFTRAWIRGLSPFEVAPFLRTRPLAHNLLLRELILARSDLNQPLPAPGRSPLERLARVLTLQERGELPAARALYATLRPPKVSPLYYALRDNLDPDAARQASAAERWQDWNAGGENLFHRLGPALNARAGEKRPAPANQ
jgi:hypothetical protein